MPMPGQCKPSSLPERGGHYHGRFAFLKLSVAVEADESLQGKLSHAAVI